MKSETLFASWLSDVCTEVRVEPPLQPITSETMSRASAIVGFDARLDIVASVYGEVGSSVPILMSRFLIHMLLPTILII